MTDAEAKRQFIIFAILRIGGVALFLLGIAIAFTDLLRPGGWKLLGGMLVNSRNISDCRISTPTSRPSFDAVISTLDCRGKGSSAESVHLVMPSSRRRSSRGGSRSR